MGIYFMDVRNVSKAKQSAVAKAAYISGEKLHSERDNKNKFYERDEKPVSFIMKPDNAPEWALDRERLWNEAEKIEKAVNSRVAREVLIALPIELNKDDHTEIVREYVSENFISKGMVADCNIHYDKEQNPHAHILLTVRPFDEKGNWSAKSKREYLKDKDGNYIYDENNKKKFQPIDLTRGWNSKESVLEWRKNLAEIINKKYKENGLDIEVSHLSNEKLGLKEVARKRLERTEYEIEEKHKEYCAKNNIKYEPKTTFAKINQELKNSQNKINDIDNEIKKLEIEKLSISFNNNDVLSRMMNIKLDNINNRSDELKYSYLVIADRLKIPVEKINYNSVSNFKNFLDKWERSVHKKELDVKGIFKLIDLMDKDYKENKSLQKYGIDNNKYIDFRNSVISAKQKQIKDINNQSQILKDLKISFNHVEKNEYKILYKQFVMIYPEYKDIVKFQTKENGHKMFNGLNKFANNLVKEKLNEFENENLKSAETQQVRNSIRINLENAKYVIPSYFALNKKINELENKIGRREELKIGDEEIKNIMIDYFESKENVEEIKEQYKSVMNLMDNQLTELYGVDMSKVSPKLKQELLQSYLDENEIKNVKELEKEFEQEPQLNNSGAQNGNSILDALIASAINQGNNKNRYDEKNKWKKKNGFEKGK